MTDHELTTLGTALLAEDRAAKKCRHEWWPLYVATTTHQRLDVIMSMLDRHEKCARCGAIKSSGRIQEPEYAAQKQKEHDDWVMYYATHPELD